MGFWEIMVIAVGLSMDAFAVSITLGLSTKKIRVIEYLLPGIYFGFFQALMPFIGYYGGTTFSDKVQHLGHWITFVLLGLIGGNMIREGFSKKDEEINENPFKLYKMLLLAIATSIDALAVGVTFAFFKINILSAILIIGLTTFIISIGGVKIGNIFGIKYKSKAEILGGVVLVLIGIKILIEHLMNI
jgi:putative Mn2+ efflux pump MntP